MDRKVVSEMRTGATIEFHRGVFRFSVLRRRSPRDACLATGQIEWLPLDDDARQIAKFPSSRTISLSFLRVKFECGDVYVLFRGSSFVEELRGSTPRTPTDVRRVAYWNDAAAIWFSQADRSWCIMANRACSIPIFYDASGDEEVTCSNSIESLLAGSRPSVDGVGLAEALIFDAPLRDRTIWSRVRQIPAGYSLDVSTTAVAQVQRMKLRIGGHVVGDSTELTEEAARLTQFAVRRAAGPAEDVLIPLSGGLDSRGIAACLPPGLRRARSVGYGHRLSLELVYSRAAARIAGIPWRAYPLDRTHFERSFLTVVGPAGVMTHRMHCHTTGAVMSSEPESALVLPGFMGDPVQGARAGTVQQTTSIAACTPYLLKKYRQSEASLSEMFPPEVRDGVLGDLEWLVRDATALHEPAQFDEYFFVVERQSKVITHIFNAFATGDVRLAFPYMDGAWARLFLSLYPALRLRRGLFIRALGRVSPRLMELPAVASGLGPTSATLLAQISRLQQIVEKTSLGKFSLPDPCQTENVRHVLRTVLASKLRRCVRNLAASGLISSAVAAEVDSVRYERLDAHAGFRLISLAEVLGLELSP